jgi:hypothetical protein
MDQSVTTVTTEVQLLATVTFSSPLCNHTGFGVHTIVQGRGCSLHGTMRQELEVGHSSLLAPSCRKLETTGRRSFVFILKFPRSSA